MYHVEDSPTTEPEAVETIHVYVVREGPKRPSLAPVIISIILFIGLFTVGILIPYQQPEQHALISVPAILLPLKSFKAPVSVIPTGRKTYPATTAQGTLTITNGSIISEELPKGMMFIGKDGAEVITDTSVFVPAGSAARYGVAYVSAHTAKEGAAGNIQALDINAVEGTALYIRNLDPFSGGADSYSVRFITSQDRETALSQARAILRPQAVTGLLQSPCQEIVTGIHTLSVTWTCQYVSYKVPDLPGVRVLHAQVRGNIVFLDIVDVAQPRRLMVK